MKRNLIKRRITEQSSIDTIEKYILNEKQTKFLDKNKDEINRRYEEMTKKGLIGEGRQRIIDYGIPRFNYKEFMNKVRNESGMTGFTTERIEYGENLYKKYQLYMKSVAVGMEEERQFNVYKSSYINKARETGYTKIISRVNAIFSVSDEKLKEIMETYKSNSMNKVLPNLSYYYLLVGSHYSKEELDSAVSDLDAIIKRYNIPFEDSEEAISEDIDVIKTRYIKRHKSIKLTEENIDIITSRSSIKYATTQNVSLSRRLDYVYKRLGREEKENLSVRVEDGIIKVNKKPLDTVTLESIERNYLKSRESTLKYTKQGKPYMPFVKKSLVRRYYGKKK